MGCVWEAGYRQHKSQLKVVDYENVNNHLFESKKVCVNCAHPVADLSKLKISSAGEMRNKRLTRLSEYRCSEVHVIKLELTVFVSSKKNVFIFNTPNDETDEFNVIQIKDKQADLRNVDLVIQ